MINVSKKETYEEKHERRMEVVGKKILKHEWVSNCDAQAYWEWLDLKTNKSLPNGYTGF